MRVVWSRHRVSIAVLVVGLALSALAWRSTSLYVERQEALRFDQLAEEAFRDIDGRLDDYV
ncbi:MAG: hypothetical protein OEX21_06415, partial [Betaproteobacteria bacterium]|nr:hypothetical protein [Betaproteobacteria bacterium]